MRRNCSSIVGDDSMDHGFALGVMLCSPLWLGVAPTICNAYQTFGLGIAGEASEDSCRLAVEYCIGFRAKPVNAAHDHPKLFDTGVETNTVA